MGKYEKKKVPYVFLGEMSEIFHCFVTGGQSPLSYPGRCNISEHAQKPLVVRDGSQHQDSTPPVSKVVFDKIGNFDALVCVHCGETLFESAASDKIEAEVKNRGLWGLRARSKVAEVGNGLDVRIPKPMAQFLSLEKGQEVILEPIDRNRLQVIIG